jgi:hypothetical protein
MKLVIAAILVGVLAVASYFGYQRYERSQLISSITPHIKNASIRVQNSTRFETESDSKATFKEVFERLEADIAEIEKHLIEVQTLTNPKTAAVAEPSVKYLKNCQEYLRALLQKFRRILKLSSASDRTTEALADMRSSSGYSFDYAKRRADKAIEELKEAETEAKAAKPELAAAAKKLIESSAALQGTLAADALVPVAQLQAVAEKNGLAPEAGASAAK